MLKLKPPKEFFLNYEPCNAVQEVQSTIETNTNIRQQEDWSFLAQKVVGAESEAK